MSIATPSSAQPAKPIIHSSQESAYPPTTAQTTTHKLVSAPIALPATTLLGTSNIKPPLPISGPPII